MGIGFVCDGCNSPADETVARFCKTCKKTYIAGYTCSLCGHEDVDPEGQEWGHKAHEEAKP